MLSFKYSDCISEVQQFIESMFDADLLFLLNSRFDGLKLANEFVPFHEHPRLGLFKDYAVNILRVTGYLDSLEKSDAKWRADNLEAISNLFKNLFFIALCCDRSQIKISTRLRDLYSSFSPSEIELESKDAVVDFWFFSNELQRSVVFTVSPTASTEPVNKGMWLSCEIRYETSLGSYNELTAVVELDNLPTFIINFFKNNEAIIKDIVKNS